MSVQTLEKPKIASGEKILSYIKLKPYFSEDNFVLYHGDSLKQCNYS